MKFLKKLKSGNFWISLISAGVLIAEGIFDFEIKTEYLNQILLGLMGILTLFGIVTDHGDTSVILSTSNSTENQEEKTETASNNVSNIKSICDTVSLLLNKVSINANLDAENDIINEVKEINEVLHKEAEKEEQCSAKIENNGEQGSREQETVEFEKDEILSQTLVIDEKQQVKIENKIIEEVEVPVNQVESEPEESSNYNEKVEDVENVSNNMIADVQEISIVNN